MSLQLFRLLFRFLAQFCLNFINPTGENHFLESKQPCSSSAFVLAVDRFVTIRRRTAWLYFLLMRFCF